jgi:hypothetical protein
MHPPMKFHVKMYIPRERAHIYVKFKNVYIRMIKQCISNVCRPLMTDIAPCPLFASLATRPRTLGPALRPRPGTSPQRRPAISLRVSGRKRKSRIKYRKRKSRIKYRKRKSRIKYRKRKSRFKYRFKCRKRKSRFKYLNHTIMMGVRAHSTRSFLSGASLSSSILVWSIIVQFHPCMHHCPVPSLHASLSSSILACQRV